MPTGMALAILLMAAATADAELLPGRPATAKLEIRDDYTTSTNRLIIPKKLLNSAKTVASLDTESQDGNRMRTIIASIALSLASISLIFVILRKKSAATKTAAGLFVAAAVMVPPTRWQRPTSLRGKPLSCESGKRSVNRTLRL